LKALSKHKTWQKLKKGAKYELQAYGKLFGVYIRATYDVLKGKEWIADLKTTSCETEEEFIEKAIEYDYPRQGVLYQLVSGAKEVFFVAISKKKPHNIFIFRLNDYPKLKKQALNELKFLLWYYQTYGYPVVKLTKQRKNESKKHRKSRNAHGARNNNRPPRKQILVANKRKAHNKSSKR
jgi:hypothetical protein